MTEYEFPKYAGLTNENHWIAIHSVAMSSIFISFCGSMCLFYMTLRERSRYKKRGENMQFIKYFPFFISIGDVMFGVFHIADHIMSIKNSYVTEGVGCQILGFGTVFAINYIAVWVTSTAVYLWFLVVRKHKLQFGKYGWKLHTANLTVSLGCGIIPFFYDGMGNAGAWCAAKTSPSNMIPQSIIFNTGFIIVCLCTCIVLYTWTASKLRKSSNFQASLANSTANGNKNKRNDRSSSETLALAKQMNWFIIIYILQWTPYVVYFLVAVNGHYINWIVTLVTVFLVNLGGIFNALVYQRLVFQPKKKGQDNVESRVVGTGPGADSNLSRIQTVDSISKLPLKQQLSSKLSTPNSVAIDIGNDSD